MLPNKEVGGQGLGNFDNMVVDEIPGGQVVSASDIIKEPLVVVNGDSKIDNAKIEVSNKN